jgi:uncharacterized protein
VIVLDVGVWLAAAWDRHQHHGAVKTWFDSEEDALLFCRVTQMGLLRLLSNPSVMGTDVRSRREAWGVVDELRSDSRVRWANEPLQVESVWRALSARDDESHKVWTDAYLAAFAQVAEVRLATLDQSFRARYPSVHVETLI